MVKSTPSAVPPDGGYGWVIVAASLMCNMIVYGIAKSYGIFLVYFVDYYQSSKAELAWIGSLFIGCMLVSGPLSGALINGFGSRPVIVAGSLISTVAFLLSSQAPSVRILMCTYGIMGGIGFGFINTPAVVNVGLYFSTKRALATGIAMCGIGIGSFVIPSLTAFLLEFYDWKGALIILSGIILNCIVFGALMRPVPIDFKNLHLCQRDINTSCIVEDKDVNGSANPNKKYKDSMLALNKKDSSRPLSISEMCSNCDIIQNNLINTFHTKKFSIGSELCSHIHISTAPPPPEPSNEKSAQIHDSTSPNSCSISKNSTLKPQNSSTDNAGECVTAKVSTESFKNGTMTNLHAETQSSECSTVIMDVIDTLKNTFNVSLLKDIRFLMLCLAYVIGMMGLLIPYVFLPHTAHRKGISRDKAAFLLSVIGVADLLGRLIFGYIADRPKIRSLDVSNVCVCVGGVASLAIPFCFSYSSFIFVSVLYGFFVAGYQCLPSILTVDMLGLKKLTSAYGLVCLFRGIGCIVGSPLAGALFDGAGNNNMLFYVAGALLLTSACLTTFIPYVTRVLNVNGT